MGISRATQSSTTVQRNININRLRRRDVSQIRSLWWWGKQGRGGWFRSQNQQYEDMEERLRRHQSLMMHRYSKALKRRALWDRDSTSSWAYRGCRWEREMSSSEPKRAKVEGEEDNTKKHREDWHEFHKDFESFKAAVDRAIERDPYGTLFGRRLRSPESSSSTSWTSWSWIFDPKEIKEDPVLEPEKNKQENSEMKPSATQSLPRNQDIGSLNTRMTKSHTHPHKTETITMSSSSIIYADPPLTSAAGQYVYDPISGRKVLQSPPAVTPPKPEKETPTTNAKQTDDSIPTSPQGGLLRKLFATENGLDIPVKTYKAPKVYGYTGKTETDTQPKSESKPENTTAVAGKRFETSRKREYNQLRALTLGNSIDTAAEFGGKFDPEPVKSEKSTANSSVDNEPSEKRARTAPELDEDTPLFSGTTYASRPDLSSPSNDWLANEGFRSRQGMTMPSLRTNNPRQDMPLRPTERIQPALDRRSSIGIDIPVKKFSPKIQPSIDRVIASPFKSDASLAKAFTAQSSSTELKTEQDQREDVDLLRASDVRAAAKAARVTKQAMEEKKRKERAELEKDFTTRQSEDQSSVLTSEKTTTPMPGPLGNIWKHVKQYPTGIVARTMQSVGLIPAQSDITQPGSAVKQSVVSTQPQTSAGKVTTKSDDQLQQMGSTLKEIFDEFNASAKPEAIKDSEHKAVPAFTQPTVKPGIARNLEIERHTKEFEPKLADVKDKAKAIKRELHDVSLSIGDVVNERAIAAAAERQLLQNRGTPMNKIDTPPWVEKVMIQDGSSKASSAPVTAQVVSSTEVSNAIAKNCAFIILTYNKGRDDVNVTSLNSLVGKPEIAQAKQNVMSTIGSLNHPDAFVKHFPDLDKNGYELKSGGGDILVFQRIVLQAKDAGSTISNIPSTSELRSTIAAAEAAAQPQSSSPMTGTEAVKTANVLDEIPITIPTPGPAAPTAPLPSSSRTEKPAENQTGTSLASITPTTSESQTQIRTASQQDQLVKSKLQSPNLRNHKARSQIRRQEEVFSGQQRLPSQTTSLPDAAHFQKQNPVATSYSHSSTTEDQPSFFARLRRAVRRVILTALAFGVGAYSIGVVAEGIASKAQLEGKADGPMKKLVLQGAEAKNVGERQRAGIFSTESSR